MRIAARLTDPATSHIAATMSPDFTNEHRTLIVRSLVSANGNIYDIEDRTAIDHVAVARRMSELERAGIVATTGQVKDSPIGRPCRVWSLTVKGKGLTNG